MSACATMSWLFRSDSCLSLISWPSLPADSPCSALNISTASAAFCELSRSSVNRPCSQTAARSVASKLALSWSAR
ncbi:hypothetical protein AJ88_41715 [Mesorhizobium amorphae CCBAU 01583]|nr:hypothetical protein AJ88_41715 [Mesorhizobium amorphae CCBAU 01583]